jgi:hypothetical protein
MCGVMKNRISALIGYQFSLEQIANDGNVPEPGVLLTVLPS